jgi:hypothetical protein
MSSLRLEAEVAERLRLSRHRVWERVSRLPAAFDYFPLINRAHELSPDQLYRLELGPFGYKSFSTHVECEVTVAMRAEEEIVFESVPGTGNADIRALLVLGDAGAGCELQARLVVSPRIPIPRLVPTGLLQRTANATLATGLEHGMRRVRREIEREDPI